MEKPYVSPRHAASGMINRLAVNPDDNLLPFLSFYPINTEDLEGSYVDRLKQIERLGNIDVIETKVLTGDLEQLLKKVERRFEKLNNKRGELPYAIDGLVLSLAKDEHQDAMGRSGRTNKWQIALKFDPASAVGEVKGIELSNGKKGFRTIQIMLKEPVLIDGVRYDHVPALSADIFEKFDLAEGDLIRIHRVGDVIPSISIEKRKGWKKIELPKKCPVCGCGLIWEAKKLKCVNSDCAANLIGMFLTFFDYTDIKGVGEVEARALVNAGIGTFDKLVDDIDKTIDLWKAAGYTKESAKALQSNVIDALKNMWDYEFIGHCGIPGIGPETAKRMFLRCRHDEFRITPGMFATIISGELGNINNRRIMSADERNRFEELYNVADAFCKRSTPEHFANLKSVGHTGGMPSKETQKVIRSLGWEIVDGKKFDYLIVPNYSHESTKTKVAKDKGIEMFTEEDFVEEFSSDV